MEEIGTSDLSDPAQNVRTGCAVLGHLLGEYGAQRDALTAYNTGSPGTSSYAEETLARADAWEEILRQGKEYSDGTHADAGNAAGH